MSERERFEMRVFDFAAGEDGGWTAWSECSESDYLHYDGRRADVQVRRVSTVARSGQAAPGSSQGARSDDMKKLADAQDDDRAAFAWWCRKNGLDDLKPYFYEAVDAVVELVIRTAQISAAARSNVQNGVGQHGLIRGGNREDLSQVLASKPEAMAQAYGIGQPEAPTAAPLSLAAKNESLRYDFSRTPDFDDILDWMRKYAPEYLAHPPARSVADPTGRTPTDYALEFAEYMAKAVELFLTVIGREDARRLEMEEDAHDTAALMDAFDQAHTKRVDYAAGLRNDIYEFRKRRDRAIARSGAGSEEGQG